MRASNGFSVTYPSSIEFSKAMLNMNRPIACRFTTMSYLASGFVGKEMPIKEEYRKQQTGNDRGFLFRRGFYHFCL